MDQKRVALFDIDQTIYDGYLIFPLAEHFFAENIVGKHVVDSLLQDFHLYKSKQVDYETSVENFNRHWASGLKGHTPDAILKATKGFLETKGGSKFFPFAESLLQFLKKAYDIYFVTGEVQCVGEAVADRFSAHGYVSSEMEIGNGLFTGNITISLARKEGKRDAIKRLLKAYPYEGSLGFGDSEGDIELLHTVAHAFCVNATEGLRGVAAARGWHIVTPLSIIDEVKKVV